MELATRIEQVLDTQVRPQLALHQGGIELVDCDETSGVLRVRLTGQCAGCPSAALTTQQLVAEQVCEAVAEIHEVVLVNGVSDGLLQEARELLTRRHK
ncbi:MAG: NifU family protein [Anaerotruncus sp.]|nr:NifU family protein [Anaerotruncus sp.]